MTSVVLTGEFGNITEIIEIGPTSLVRRRSWANLQPLAHACKTAGLTTTSLPYGPLPDGLASPTVWLLSDLPFLAAEEFGILGRLQVDVPARSGLVMIGGAFSFGGLKAVGGWQDPRGASLLPVEPTAGADDTEVPNGIRLVPLVAARRGLPRCSRTARRSSVTTACVRAPGPVCWPRSRTASQRSSYPRRRRIAPWHSRPISCPIGGRRMRSGKDSRRCSPRCAP